MENVDDDEDYYVHSVVNDLFNGMDCEQWCLRRPADNGDGTTAATPAKKKLKGISYSLFQEFTEEHMWIRSASFLDPHEIDNWATTCKAARAVLSYSDADRKLRPSFSVRLQSVFDYFRILKMYADQLERLEYDWAVIVKLFTFVAHEMQKRYGNRYEVHPLHRALVAESILEQLCNRPEACGTMAVFRDDIQPWLDGYGQRNSNNPLNHFRRDAKKQDLSTINIFASSTEWSVSLGDPEKEQDAPEGFLKAWLQHASENISNYNEHEAEAISDGRCPVIWIFSWNDSNGSDSGIFFHGEKRETQIKQWWPYYDSHTNDAPPILPWRNSDRTFKGLVHYFLLLPGVMMDGEELGCGQQLFRMAWLKAHGIAPFNQEHNALDWKLAMDSITEEDDEDQGVPLDVDLIHANVRAAAIDGLLPMAKASDYVRQSETTASGKLGKAK